MGGGEAMPETIFNTACFTHIRGVMRPQKCTWNALEAARGGAALGLPLFKCCTFCLESLDKVWRCQTKHFLLFMLFIFRLARLFIKRINKNIKENCLHLVLRNLLKTFDTFLF